MFERYTEQARKTIFFAKHEATQFGSKHIETEHLLLALLNDAFLTSRVFEGISVQNIREEILSFLPRALPTSGDLPLSNSAKRALSYGAEEADRLTDRQIRNQHLLLGLMRVEDCYASRVLRQKGLLLDSLRLQIAKLSPEEETRSSVGQAPERFWKSPGIPPGYAWPRLLYNQASEVLIVELQAAGQRFLPTRLFMRHRNSESYQPIGTPAEDVSYQSPVTCEKEPIVVFNSLRVEKIGKGYGGNWSAVCSFNLKTKELSVCVATDTISVPQPHTRAWISNLVSLSSDGRNLYANLAIEASSHVVNYYLASLDLMDGKIELVCHLKDSFF